MDGYGREYALLLRCWREDACGGWRFFLEPIGQEWDRACIANASELLAILQHHFDCYAEDKENGKRPFKE